MSKIKSTYLSAALVLFGGNIFGMRISSSSQLQTGKKAARVAAERIMSAIEKELMVAGWSQEKIREFRHKRDAKGELLYPVHYSISQQDTLNQKRFNDLLINHYYQKIYTALQTVPVDERAAWADELHLLLFIGLDNFKKGGKKRFEQGTLKMINYADDGSEIGAHGTKYAALKKVKETTNNLQIIPFNDGKKITPVEFFEKISKPDLSQDIKEIVPEIKVIQKQRRPLEQPKMSEQQREELKKTFEFERQSEQPYKQILQPIQEKQGAGKMEQAIHQKIATLKPGEFFIYERGTSEGVIVSWHDIEKSENLAGMLESFGWVTRIKSDSGEKLVFDENLWQRDQAAISLPFSIEVLEIIFGHSRVGKLNKSPILLELSWDQLVNLIECSDYLMLSGESSDEFGKAVAYWVNKIGIQLLNLSIEMRNYDEKSKSRSIKEIENDLPDYSIFDIFTKNKDLSHQIVSFVLKIKNNFCEEYAVYEAKASGSPLHSIDKLISLYFYDIENKSIIDLLNVVRRRFMFWKETHEESQQWFWQRWFK